MTCIKTGARIYFENYGMLVPGDIYAVGNCVIIRWSNVAPRFGDDELPNASHYVPFIVNSETWWHRNDLGVTVLPASMLETRDDKASGQDDKE